MNNWIGPTVKHVWNDVLHNFWDYINTIAFCSSRYSLHLLLLKSSSIAESKIVFKLAWPDFLTNDGDNNNNNPFGKNKFRYFCFGFCCESDHYHRRRLDRFQSFSLHLKFKIKLGSRQGDIETRLLRRAEVVVKRSVCLPFIPTIQVQIQLKPRSSFLCEKLLEKNDK